MRAPRKRRHDPETTPHPFFLNGLTEAEVERLLMKADLYRSMLEATAPENTALLAAIHQQLAPIKHLLDPKPYMEFLLAEKARSDQEQQNALAHHQLLSESPNPIP